MKKIDLNGISVLIVMVVKGTPTMPTIISLLRTVEELAKRGIENDVIFMLDGNVEYARTKAAHDFLKGTHHRMFCIDADMEWTVDNFLRVLALSMRMDIVGAFYTARCDPPKFFFNFDKPTDKSGEVLVMENEWGCLPARSGMGFVCCSRWAVQKVTDSMEKIKFSLTPEPMAHIFDCAVVDGEFMGEDMAFFWRARQLGIGVFFDPNITLGHVGQKTYQADFKDWVQRVEAAE